MSAFQIEDVFLNTMMEQNIFSDVGLGRRIRRFLRTFTVVMVSVSMCWSVYGQDLRIDHVVSVHQNLTLAIEEYSQMGFTIKRGHLHDNGLINAHVKFENGTSFELMSLSGSPQDMMAVVYDSLIKIDVKGAYLALTGINLPSLETALRNQEIVYEVKTGKLWDYITFPAISELAHIFFIVYHKDFREESEYTTHKNGADGIQHVTLEGSFALISLLTELGLVNDSPLHSGIMNYDTPTGSIKVRVVRNPDRRPRIEEIVFGTKTRETLISISLNK